METGDIIGHLEDLKGQLEGAQRQAVAGAVKLIEDMGDQIRALKRSVADRYRRSSEKIVPGQLTLALLSLVAHQTEAAGQQDADAEADANANVDTDPETLDQPEKPKRKKRTSGVKLLRVEKVVRELSDEEKICSNCNGEMDVIGVDVSRQVVHTPGRLHMLEEHLEKCACRQCKEGMGTAAGTPKPIEGGLASSSLLAHIAVSKTIDAIPVERLGRMFERDGFNLASSTLHDWFGFIGEQARLLDSVVLQDLRASGLISLDDTRLLSKQAIDREGTLNGRLWLYIGDVSRIALCRFTPDWKGSHPAKILEGFEGNVQLDGYGGLNPLFRTNGQLNRVGCNDHCRRHFVRALTDGDTRAAVVVDVYRRIYEVEARARAMEFDPSGVLGLRQRETKPLWNELDAAVAAAAAHNPPRRSPLAKGVSYWSKQRPYLGAFLEDGFLPISNAHVERLLRGVALFRKNSLFVGNVEAGHRYAALMTLMVNCILCGANPYEYITDFFDRLATRWPASRKGDLLPQAWLAAKQHAE